LITLIETAVRCKRI